MNTRKRHYLQLLFVFICLDSLGIFFWPQLLPSSQAAQVESTSPKLLKRNVPKSGLIYNGLKSATKGSCRGYFQLLSNKYICTHGPDKPPRRHDFTKAAKPLKKSALKAAPLIECDGDGTTGNRTQVMYVRSSDVTDRYNRFVASIQQWAAGADAIYNNSAAKTGGSRHIRFVHDASCNPTVLNIVLSPKADDNFDSTINELTSLGYDRSNRRYMIFMDANVYCGIGTLYPNDSSGQNNPNNYGPDWGRTDTGCWDTATPGFVPAHEHMHNMGAVQDSAPNSSKHGHCTDEYDVMCYKDGSDVVLNYPCANSPHENLFDCNNDDYFNTDPPAGNYLATHWNTANNQFLIAAGSTPTGADLVLGMTDSPDPVTVGGNLTYAISVRNNGPETAVNVRVVDTLPPGATFVAGASSANCSQSGDTITCELSDLASGASAAVQIVATLSTPGAISNTATGQSDASDPNTSNNSSTVVTTVSALTSITVTSPNGGETWRIGRFQTISWNASGVSGYFRIRITRDGGNTWTTLATVPSRARSYRWRVSRPTTTQALIRVESVSTNISDNSDGSFSISN